MKSRDNTTTTTEVIPFGLKLPTELDIKPKWEVAVSKNYTARVFEVTDDARNPKTGEKEGVTTHFLMIVTHNKSGLRPRTIDNYNYRDGMYSPLDVKLRLEAIAVTLTPKVKTVVNEDVSDEG